MPIWFDLILLLSFAWTGLLLGLLSLRDIDNILIPYLSSKWIKTILISLLFLGSFGVYIGRYLRWNSWDFISKPLHLFLDVSDRFIHPFSHPRTWGMTILLGVF